MTDESKQDEIEVEKEAILYPCTAPSMDEQRRAFLIETLGSPEIDAKILVGNLEIVYRWLVDGSIPSAEKLKKTPTLKTV